jgi:hypothetical protein
MSFQFLTIVRNGPDSTSIFRLTVDNELHEEMERIFTTQAGKWQDGTIMRTMFKEDYSLADNEIFEIKDYILPKELLNAIRFPQEYGEFNAETEG